MPKKILIVLSEFGYWGEELVGPAEVFDSAGYELTFATPTGKRPIALPPSLDENFVDPPLGRAVTTAEMAAKAKEWNNSPRLDNPVSLHRLIPERPYLSDVNYLRALERYNQDLATAVAALVSGYDGLLIVGGSGPIVDLANNERLHALILGFVADGKVIAAECYGVTCLAFARDWGTRRSILEGKHVTGHPKEYDYKDGTGFVGTDLNMGPPPYPLEYILRDATGPAGGFHGNVGRRLSALVDYPFVTGRSTPDSQLTGQLVVEVLEHGLRRYGW
ncbi:type 1 glutamine amidotransferase domain-containing protein [Mycobacteroides chelonae]|uniref:Type 1 glutamine amidotransferase domain-containing protein n=1 Tax=Mycobacteroides chelonae TaxID=1774 RepID=A0A1S1M1B1_MYCCH|nr:type 1 glutamine amidotransferase domain-containing protein [Mycobacteroides chelonae]OHU64081.1 type 1 glutamine amidotransferase domain-containing protein [Mycobacteroides chelonae]OHU76487.1 type 1 glutamine amidotransferase domain-containing protein [Mycobacteroides chelonae]QQG90396.1 type 1 glutamine amidotransferase domain-containing protein [Mycobacteroides chelonae]QQG95213.1 type 1 glutamine amidotransferase domain-containing protein [Mycobacteroides chelonae]